MGWARKFMYFVYIGEVRYVRAILHMTLLVKIRKPYNLNSGFFLDVGKKTQSKKTKLKNILTKKLKNSARFLPISAQLVQKSQTIE